MESSAPIELPAEIGSWFDADSPALAPSDYFTELMPPVSLVWLDDTIDLYQYPPDLAEHTAWDGQLQSTASNSNGLEHSDTSYPAFDFEQLEAGFLDNLEPAFDPYLAEVRDPNTSGENTSSILHGNASFSTENHPSPAGRFMRQRKLVSGSDRLRNTRIDGKHENSRRSFISSSVRTILQERFKIDAYPKEREMKLLSEETGLTLPSIRAWFTNTRSRIESVEDFSLGRSKRSRVNANVIEKATQDTPAMASVSAANLAVLNQSCTASSTPLDEYLRIECNEDCNSTEATFATAPRMNLTREISSTFLNVPISSSPLRPPSVTGSESSAGSMHSSQSHISLDSRGFRRGRKRWRSVNVVKPADIAPNDSPERRNRHYFSIKPLSPPIPTKKSRKTGPAKYSCTWPDCYATFRNRFEWVRHEDAVHYCPYRWICCAGNSAHLNDHPCFICGEANVSLGHYARMHFASCAQKRVSERAFFREDQLAQHILGVHLGQPSQRHKEDKETIQYKVPKSLLSAWKSENPSFNHAHLRCGFCGVKSADWSKRQDHVFEHMRNNMCKTAWWPHRLPPPTCIYNGDIPSYCPTCGKKFESFAAARRHPRCVSWSCRYLHDWHHIFQTTRLPGDEIHSTCKLCAFETSKSSKGSYLQVLDDHAKLHSIRNCGQALFQDLDDFGNHLRQHHAAGAQMSGLQAWACFQHSESRDGVFTIRMVRECEETDLCNG